MGKFVLTHVAVGNALQVRISIDQPTDCALLTAAFEVILRFYQQSFLGILKSLRNISPNKIKATAYLFSFLGNLRHSCHQSTDPSPAILCFVTTYIDKPKPGLF